jgi:hypothetical protein
MALVLCTGIDKTLLETRRLILEKAGHTVVTASDEKAVMDACQKHAFDVAVVGQTISPKMKPRVAQIVRRSCPGAKILELYTPNVGQMLHDADAAVMVPTDVPKELADCVDELAKQKG